MMDSSVMNVSLVGFVVIGLLAVLAVVGVSGAIGLLTRRHHNGGEYEPSHPRPGSNAGTKLAIGMGGAVCVLLVAFVAVSKVSKNRQDSGQYSEQAHDLPHSQTATVETQSSSFTATIKSGSDSSSDTASDHDGNPGSESLPAWTAHEERILEVGEVPKVWFVVGSELCSTEDEARLEAEAIATAKLEERLGSVYVELKSWPIPKDVFRTASLQQSFTQTSMHQFGIYEEPMYQVYLQFEDSARVREPIVEAWERSAVSGQVAQYSIGMGVLALLLGTFSAAMRGVAAPSGHKRGPVITAAALGVAAVAALLV